MDRAETLRTFISKAEQDPKYAAHGQLERWRAELASIEQPAAVALPGDHSTIPPFLRDLRQWLVWKMAKDEKGRPTKVPYQVNGALASSTNSSTWSTFNEVNAARDRFDGIGIVLANGIAGIDLDHHINDAGEFTAEAEAILREMNSYAEFSPSGTGIHILYRGSLPPGRRKIGDPGQPGYEMYDSGRFFTFTGLSLEGYPGDLEERTAEAAAVHKRVFGEQQAPAAAPAPAAPVTNLDDTRVLDLARAAKNGAKFSALYAGDCAGYPSQSEADLALANELVFWTGGDVAQADRLFRSSGLYREKWDEKHGAETYASMTMRRALAGRNADDFYRPPMTYPTPEDLDQAGSYTFDPAVHPWLVNYLEWSQKWSPRSPLDFHIAGALFVLSTVAARRIGVHFGGLRYPSLYMAMVAWSSVHAKTTAASLATDLIRAAGVDFLLAQDNATPQKFLSDLTEKYPTNYDKKDAEGKIKARKRLAFAGKRGWFFNEFGQQISAMMQPSGYMADFRGLLRSFDDGLPDYESGTIGRGDDIIKQPYLALFASMTIDDIRPFAKKGSALWGDGFLARFGLITPKTNGKRSRERFPEGERHIPTELLRQLREWHNRLGERDVRIVECTPADKGRPAEFEVQMDPFITKPLEMPQEVRDLYYAYDDTLMDIVEDAPTHDLDGNYSRFPEKALRISILLASIEGRDAITPGDWTAARNITERWRAGLHELYRQVNAGSPSKEREEEERVLLIITRMKGATRRDISRHSRYARDRINTILEVLLDSGDIEAREEGRTTRYYIAGVEGAGDVAEG